MASRYGKLNRKGSKATGEISVGVVNGQPSIQVNSGGKIYGTQLNQIGAGGISEALNVSDIQVTGRITFTKNSKVLNNSNRLYMTGGLTTSGDNNMAIGSDSNLSSLIAEDSVGTDNTGNITIGVDCMKLTINGTSNIAIGNDAMKNMGRNASELNGDTFQNVAIGESALAGPVGGSRTQSHSNVAIGWQAMASAHFGDSASATTAYNTCVGRRAGLYTTSASNTFIGFLAGEGSDTINGTTGGGNTSVGANALADIDGGDYNVAVGFEAGDSITDGDDNICIGHGAGDNITTGSDNVIIGGVDASAVDVNDELRIASGDGGVLWLRGDSNGSVGIGGTPLNSTIGLHVQAAASTYIDVKSPGEGQNAGILFTHGGTTEWYIYSDGGASDVLIITSDDATAINVSQAGAVYFPQVYADDIGTERSLLIQADGQIGYDSSSKVFKTNIESITDVSWINELNPVTYYLKKKDENGNIIDEPNLDKGKQHGLIAEELWELQPDLCHKATEEEKAELNLETDAISVKYDHIVPALIKAIQELSAKVEALDERITT